MSQDEQLLSEQDWKALQLVREFQMAYILLSIHDLITRSECDAIKQRVIHWAKENGLELRVVRKAGI